jgi:hypothetical protein
VQCRTASFLARTIWQSLKFLRKNYFIWRIMNQSYYYLKFSKHNGVIMYNFLTIPATNEAIILLWNKIFFFLLKEDCPTFSAIGLPRHTFISSAAGILLRRMKYEDRFVNYSDVDTRRVIILVNKIHLFSKYTYFISKSVNCNFLDHKNCLKFTARKQDQMCFYNTKYRAGKKRKIKKKLWLRAP